VALHTQAQYDSPSVEGLRQIIVTGAREVGATLQGPGDGEEGYGMSRVQV
jgi:hypothetical protein